MSGSGQTAEAVVLTALNLEYRAAREHLTGLRRATHVMGTRFDLGHLPGVAGLSALGRTGEGNTAAAVVAARAIEAFRPRALLFVGVAGAVKDDLELGDVVVATRVYAVHGAKEDAGRSYARPNAFNAAHELLEVAQDLDAARERWDAPGPRHTGFRVHFKPIAAGEVVLNSRQTALAAQLREHYNDTVAIEMESAGAAQAAHLSRAVPMLVVRGISDKADGAKHAADAAGGQPAAAANAAAVAFAVIREWAATPLPEASARPSAGSGRDGTWVAAPAVVYNALPPDTTAFTGRASEIARITTLAEAAAVAGGVVAISAIDGMPGVGKTAPAVHLAHRLAGRFPDRQLLAQLHAHAEGLRPARPEVVLSSLLVGDGLEPRALPTDLDELSALWRTRMAGRRALLVLDDAASSAQVAPLLPGTGTCLVLVTSRRHLGDLPYAVAQLTLDVLPRDEATAMFLCLAAPRAAAAVEGSEGNEGADEDTVAALVEAAGCLPLAIALYAAFYRKHPAWTLSDLLHEARTAGLMLTGEQRTVAAAFDLSYRALPPDRQRFFRLLGLHVGTDLDPHAAAALTGTTIAEASEHLDTLLGDRLLTETVRRRYGMHELIRTHARALAVTLEAEPTRDRALDRLLHYYAHTAQIASLSIARYPRTAPDGPAPDHAPALRDPGAARGWLRTERPNLEAAFNHAHAHASHGHTIALAAGLAEILQIDGPWSRALEVHQTTAEAAERSGSAAAHASALNDLGRGCYLIGDLPRAINALTSSLELHRPLGSRLGEANALIDLGRVQRIAGDLLGAVDAPTRALDLYREIGDHGNEAWALSHYAAAVAATGDRPRALVLYGQALTMNRELNKPDDEAISLESIAEHHLATGEPGQGAALLSQALEIYQRLGMRADIERVTTRLAAPA